ncbi:MAG: glutamate--tRNA ligase [Acidobacteriota bacterium]
MRRIAPRRGPPRTPATGPPRFDVAAAEAVAEAVEFVDRVHGPVRFPLSQIGDFVILRRDGRPSYNFAVVVDDLLMEITHVIRGDDHLSNTPRQILLHRALGASTLPEFAHLPLIAAPGGAPLSKREGPASIARYRERGYPPEALLNALALLGWSPPGGQELLTPEELVAMFDLDRVSSSPATFDQQKLDALATRHMARLPEGRLAALAAEQLARAGLLPDPIPPVTWEWVGRLARLFSERLPNMGALVEEASFLFDFDAGRCLAEAAVRETLTAQPSRAVIESLVERIGEGPLTAPRFLTIAEEVRRETGAKGRELFHPIRVALTGATSGPELVRLLPVIDSARALPLPRPVASCVERARALLEATGGDRR